MLAGRVRHDVARGPGLVRVVGPPFKEGARSGKLLDWVEQVERRGLHLVRGHRGIPAQVELARPDVLGIGSVVPRATDSQHDSLICDGVGHSRSHWGRTACPWTRLAPGHRRNLDYRVGPYYFLSSSSSRPVDTVRGHRSYPARGPQPDVDD